MSPARTLYIATPVVKSHACGLRGYRPKQADELASARKQKRYHPRMAAMTWVLIEQLLRPDPCPELVSGWLAKEKHESVSHERI